MKHQLELRHFRYFLAVADQLHFRKAAEQLYISQPGLTRQIKQLEKELGLQLFNRHNRKVQLTTSGQYLQKELSKALKNIDLIVEHAKLLDQGFTGNLKFGYIGSAMQGVIPELLLKIRKHLPNIRFDLKEIDNNKQIKDIQNRDLDFGFVRMDQLPYGISKKAIHQDSFSLVLPENHPIDQNNFRGLHQLKEAPFILFDATYSQSYYDKVMQIFEDSGFRPLISHNTVHAYTIYSLVENNFGVSIVPTSLLKGYNMKIKSIALSHIKQRTTLHMIWKDNNPNPVMSEVLKLIR